MIENYGTCRFERNSKMSGIVQGFGGVSYTLWYEAGLVGLKNLAGATFILFGMGMGVCTLY